MKRYFLLITAVIATLFIASCSKVENPSAPGAEAEVTFSVQTPEIQTRAIGDGSTVDKLKVAVYYNNGTSDVNLPGLTDIVDVNNGYANVTLKLVNGVNYKLVFWAYNENAPYAFNTEEATLTVNYNNITANNENLDAFYWMQNYTPTGPATEPITLKRPFAQLNMVTGDFAAAQTVGVNVNTTSIIVDDVYQTMNMLTGVVTGKTTVTFKENTIPGGELTGYPGYKWLAMNYLLVNDKELVNVTMRINDNTSGREFPNVPVQRNHRTIIYGDLLSSNITFDVDIDSGFDDAQIVVYDDVTYAVADNETEANDLFALGSKAVYIESITAAADIKLPKTNDDVYLILPGTTNTVTVNYADGATTAADKPANIYISIPEGTVTTSTINTGESTVYLNGSVTNLTASTASNTLYLIDATVGTLTIEKGNVYVDGESTISTVTKGSDNDEATKLYVETGATVPNGNIQGITKVSNEVTTFAELKTAIENGCPTITLGANITATEILVINKNITLDGNYKTLTSTAGRAINVSGAEGVTIQNLIIECTGERGINIIQNATNVTINNVTATADNYTVNVGGSAANAIVTITGSTLTGKNVVNVAAEGANVTVSNSTLNCEDDNKDESYAALCLGKESIGGQIIATGTIINVTENSGSKKARNNAEDGVVTIDGSTDDVTIMVAAITFEGSDYYYTFESLEDAITYINEHPGGTIKLLRDITTLTVIEINSNIKIDGNNKTITSSVNRVFRLRTPGITVTMNDLNIVSEAVSGHSDETDIRGISFDGVGGMNLTLTNCTVDFTDDSANGHAYGVNMSGSNQGVNELTINGGTYEGANAININGNGHTISIDGAILTSLYKYTPGDNYTGACVAIAGESNKLTVKNSTFNGDHAVGIKERIVDGTNYEGRNTITKENNTDNTKITVSNQ